jgi:hypothetical protein
VEKRGYSADRNEPHVLSTNRFRDGFGIDEVVLVRLHERLHKLRRNQLYVVTLLSQGAAQKCAPEQASRPIKEVDMFAVKTISCRCVNFFRTNTLPPSPRATR